MGALRTGHDEPLGLYVHIPFCARRCPYCDFAIHIGAGPELRAAYVAALRREIQDTLAEHAAQAPRRGLSSIFFGGGTPTLLAAAELAGLLHLISDYVEITPDAEISLEANPDGLDEARLTALRAAGWNRLSLGAQSFDDDALRRLGRTHNGARVKAAVGAARQAGFTNLSLDLMFALPGQSRESWRHTIEQALQLQPEHVSCYALTIEEHTPFAGRVKRGRLAPVEEDAQAAQMEETVELLEAGGLKRYEVSNYARSGRECRHNLNYWRGGDYLACGCGAHGHRSGHRWWNERSAPAYVEAVRRCGSARAGEEKLTPRERLAEIVMLGLRMREGFSLPLASRRLGIDARQELNGELASLRRQGIVREENGVVWLAPEAVPLADAVAERLIP